MTQSLELASLLEHFNNYIAGHGSPEQDGYEEKHLPYVTIQFGQLKQPDILILSNYITETFSTEGKFTHLLPTLQVWNGELSLVVDKKLVREFIIPKLLIQNSPMSLEDRAKGFFKNLINITGDYFLSDYVENIMDYVPKKLSKKLATEIIQERDLLAEECSKNKIDFHVLSCKVANKFLADSINS